MWCPEQFEHRNIGQWVTAVRGRIDEAWSGSGKEQVPRPQVAVKAGERRILILNKERIASSLYRCLLYTSDAADE